MSSFDPNVHVPGAWRCAKCGFRLQQANLNAGDGTITARDDAGDKCPNDGAPLWRVTWRDDYKDLYDQAAPLILRDRFVDRLCSEEVATVAFTGDNPDFNGLPNCAVSVTASFTNWNERIFRADSVNDALLMAETAKCEFEGS